MSNSNLVNQVIMSPNCNSPRNHKIDKITIHHMAGYLSITQCGNLFANPSREASSNYGIDSDGNVGLFVDESNRAWTSGSPENDNRAVTIEVANCSGEPNWEVSDKAYNKLIDLCVDICKRNDIKALNWTGDSNGNLTCHYMFQATACPGPYLKSKMPEIANAVNVRLGSGGTEAPAPSSPTQTKVNVTYQSMVGGRWLGEIVNKNDVNENGYSGIYGQPIQNFAVKVDKGSVWYQAHELGKGWLGKISQFNLADFNNGFAGNNTQIDAIRVYFNTPSDIIKASGYKKAKYRVHLLGGNWLGWQYDDETCNFQDGYAGIIGRVIDGIQIVIE